MDIEKILSNKILKNGVWLYFLQIFNTVLPLITLPYITRVLSVSQYGVFSIALNLVVYLQVIVEYGFDMSATRKVSLMNDNNDVKKYNEIFTSVLLSRLLLLLVSFGIVLVYILLNGGNQIQNLALLMLFLSVVGSFLQQNWLFQGLQEMKYISIVNMISRTISVILIFTLVKKPSDLLLYCFLYSISPIISGVLGIIIAKRNFDIKLVKLTLSKLIIELKDGWYVFTTSLSGKIFGAIGITFLGIFSEEEIVGTYSAIQKIPSMLLLMWMPIGQVLYPIVSRKMKNSFDEGKHFVYKSRRIIMPFFIIIVILISIFSKDIVSLAFGEQYIEYSYWIIPLSMWMIFAINNNFLGIQILLGSGKDKEYSQCFQIGVVFTIILNFIFIYFFQGNGASWAPLISEVLLSIMLIRKIKKI